MYCKRQIQGLGSNPLDDAEDIYQRSLMSSVGGLNRAERRTAQGRMLVAQAEAKALREKLDYLEQYVIQSIDKGAA